MPRDLRGHNYVSDLTKHLKKLANFKGLLHQPLHFFLTTQTKGGHYEVTMQSCGPLETGRRVPDITAEQTTPQGTSLTAKFQNKALDKGGSLWPRGTK
ncbi:hypothetical protein BaRGS_00020914 [Batillaria attramentaria]|uniref:Uncharacterized protein n=1 Tax=Batillaria attramentaria TaxID=370345 RepID=A0ABD0KLC5_9CAEN